MDRGSDSKEYRTGSEPSLDEYLIASI